MDNFKEMTNEELDLSIGLYISAGVQVDLKPLKNKALKTEWLENALKEHGRAHQVTEDDMKANPDMPNDIAVGDVVLLPVPVPPKPQVQPAITKRIVPPSAFMNSMEKTETAPSTSHRQKTYEGEFVTHTDNVIRNGRLYVDVHTATRVARLTKQQFEDEVNKKNG